MLELPDKNAVKEVKKLINARKAPKAITNILAKGRFIRELTENEVTKEASDLILTDTNAHWNLF